MEVKLMLSPIGVLVILLPDMRTMAIRPSMVEALQFCTDNNLTVSNGSQKE